MKLRAYTRVEDIADDGGDLLFVHNHDPGYPEHNGWKLRPEIHDYLVQRGINYTITGGWTPRPDVRHFFEIAAPDIGDDDLVYISMKWLKNFSLFEGWE